MIRIRHRGGCVPFDFNEEGKTLESALRVLLVRNSSGDKWVLPKGGVKPNKDNGEAWKAAMRETEEEAGVKGVLVGELTCVETDDDKTQYFLLFVTKQFDQKERDVLWMSLHHAQAALKKKLKPVLENVHLNTDLISFWEKWRSRSV